MSRRIIISGSERTVNPWISGFLSLIFTGLGHLYAGSASQGIIFLLLRIFTMVSLPFYTLLKNSKSLSSEIFLSLIMFIIITLTSALHSFFITLNKNLKSSWYNTPVYYITFSFLSLSLTLISIMIFFSFFNIIRISTDAAPLLRKGDVVAIKKISKTPASRSDLILLKNNKSGIITRIIGLPGESITYKNARFSINDFELPLAIFTETELRNLAVSDYDVISEQNGMLRYPVIKGDKNFTIKASLAEKEYFISPDNRRDSSSVMKISAEEIKAVIEGVVYSPSSGFLPGKTYLPAE